MALILLAALAGCGSSSKKTSSTASGHASHAAVATLLALRRAGVPAGAAKPTRNSLTGLPHVALVHVSTPHIVGISSLTSLEAVVSALANDLNAFWSKKFAEAKLQWPEVHQAFVSAAPVSTQPPCPTLPTKSPDEPDGVCAGTFYWTLPWMHEDIKPFTDVAVAFNVATLFSAQAQIALGFAEAVQKGTMTKAQFAQQNVCFTGLWARTLAERSLLEENVHEAKQLEELVKGLSVVLDVSASELPPESLAAAFFAAYNSGNPGVCLPSSGSGGTTTGTTETTATSATGAP